MLNWQRLKLIVHKFSKTKVMPPLPTVEFVNHISLSVSTPKNKMVMMDQHLPRYF